MIRIPDTTRSEFIRDVLVTACEGGINYWAKITEYQPSKIRAVIFEIPDDPDDGVVYHTIDGQTIRKGLRLICTCKVEVREDILKGILYGNAVNDSGEIDAERADCIIQAALFNEIKYS